MLRDYSDAIKQAGLLFKVEEIELDNEYKVIFTIDKN